MDRDEIIRVLQALETARLEYVLIGATAMGFHGIVRATEDLDLLIRATTDNIERLRVALRQVYDDDAHINEISTADLLGEYPAVRYYPPSGDLFFDVLTRLGDVASFETVEAETKDIQGTKVRVATPRALHKLRYSTRTGSRGRGGFERTLQLEGRNLNMTVQKFRSIEEMNNASVHETRKPDFEQFLRHCARYWAIAPKSYPRGVFKFRSIEEAQLARKEHDVLRESQ